MEESMAPRVDAWLAKNKEDNVNITFNSAYRTEKEQRDLQSDKNATTPAEAGKSDHEAGRAFDVNWKKIPESKKAKVVENAAKAGIRWGGKFNDPQHFYRRPHDQAKKIAEAHAQKEIGPCGK
jgi:hypothetical protein